MQYDLNLTEMKGKYRNQTFLTIPEMQELKDLGMDTSDARYRLVPLAVNTPTDSEVEGIFYYRERPGIFNDPNFFVYSLADIIEKLELTPNEFLEISKPDESIYDFLFRILKERFKSDPSQVKLLEFEKEMKEPEHRLDSSVFLP